MNDRERTRTIQVPGGEELRRPANMDSLSTQVISDTTNQKVGSLKVVDGPGKGQERPIFSGTNQVGRNIDNRIPLDFGDNTISRQQHAVIAYDAASGDFRIFDGGKQNPVSVNGERLAGDRSLNDGDTIKIGLTTLRFAVL
ncbi:MAG: FHA domain-containing protein [Hyphomicrobiaceae bacterium]|nr:FHA domain-containing protein [Hyphomicrobiaceae bacterium]